MSQHAAKMVTVQSKSAGKALLVPADFTLLGHYTIDGQSLGTGLNWGRGLTHRYVGGQLRFLRIGYGGSIGSNPLCEFKLVGAYGATLGSSAATGNWNEIFSPALSGPNIGDGDEFGIWWDTVKGGLWSTDCTDYPDDTQVNNTLAVCFRTLNANGTISGFKGRYGFSGIGQRAIFGGVRATPAWPELASVGPYLYGFGGYTSRMAQGLACSLGLMLLGGPDVTINANNTVLPVSSYKILADHRSGTLNSAWYPTPGTITTFDRNQRVSDVTETYDNWKSPAPDGFGRWTWGDTYDGAFQFIDGPNKRGAVGIASLAKGTAKYVSSSLTCTGVDAELDIYDPLAFAQVLAGTKQPYNVQPAATKLLTADFHAAAAASTGAQGGSTHFVDGATFDTTTNILWLCCPIYNTYNLLLMAYGVNC